MSKIAKYALTKAKESAARRWEKNPPIKVDLIEYVVPGAVAFAATNIAMNIGGKSLAARMAPAPARLGAGLLMGAGLWALAHYTKWGKKYHSGAVIGAGLALLVEGVKRFAPALAPVVGEAPLAMPRAMRPVQSASEAMPEVEPLEDYSAPIGNRPSKAIIPFQAATGPVGSQGTMSEEIDVAETPSEWSDAWPDEAELN